MGEAYGIAAPAPRSTLHGVYAEAIERWLEQARAATRVDADAAR
jgi:hypothetical protein